MQCTRYRSVLGLLLTLAVGAWGCDSDDGDDGGGSADPASLEAAVEEAATAWIEGDVEGTYAFLSRDCRDEVSLDDWDEMVAVYFNFGTEPGTPVEEVETRNVEDGRGEARVTAGEPIEFGARYSTWVDEDGAWRATDCVTMFDDDPKHPAPEYEVSDVDIDTDEASSTIEVDGGQYEALLHDPEFEGTYTVTVLAVEEITTPIVDPEAPDEIYVPEGKFVAVRYEVVDDTGLDAGEFNPQYAFEFNVVLTDGSEAWYPHEDERVAGDLAIGRGDHPGYAESDPGETVTSWMVFDVPVDAETTALVFGLRPWDDRVEPVVLVPESA